MKRTTKRTTKRVAKRVAKRVTTKRATTRRATTKRATTKRATTKRAPGPVFTDVARGQRIHVNRNLRMGSVRAIGFDMDHTLACYEPHAFEGLAFDQAKAKLVAAGYPRAVGQLAYDREFVIRGLIVDKRRGNILKMDRHHYVVQAFHGTRKLPPEMRKTLYARRRLRVTGTTFVPVDTLFSVPEISLYAQMVDLMDARERRPNYHRLYDDVRGVVDEAHADGSIKQIIARSPLQYLEVDPALAETLDRMRAHGMKLFLLTNSESTYTGLAMDLMLSHRLPGRDHWTDFFDLIVVRAGKPAFFARHDALQPVDPGVFGLAGSRRARFTFTGGSVGAFEHALGIAGDAILYFGDHTYGDIMKSKRACGWRTALIIPRLEEEIAQLDAVRRPRHELEQLERRSDQLSADRDFVERALEGGVPGTALAQFLRERGSPGTLAAARAALDRWGEELAGLALRMQQLEAAIDARFNPYWGSMFRAGREISHFGDQVEEFACIYTGRVSNFRNYPMDKYFTTAHESLPHER
jgi:5'-nucleotidase